MVLIPALPLLACLIVAFGGKWIGEKSHLPVALAIGASFILSLVLLFQVHEGVSQIEASHEGPTPSKSIGFEHTYTLWSWATVPDAYAVGQTNQLPAASSVLPAAKYPFAIDVTLRADPLTSMMLCMVTFISTLVVIYAAGYMHGDPGYARFFSTVSAFVFSMCMLVSVSNFVLLYVFWEAVGACSYLLVGYWYYKPEAAAAGMKAFLVNRIGDFGFAIGLFLLWTTYGTLNFHDVSYPVTGGTPGVAATTLNVAGILGQTRLANPTLFVGGGVGLAICLLLMLGACGKSAQFPLHVWLPDAMEGPTPVSALIHAATMVTAGCYMVARCTPLFFVSSDAQYTVSLLGGITAALAACIALTQNDLKRVLAYSTLSQLGYMFLALGVGTFAGITAGMFHLFTHAFFKALLFLGAGSVMHAMGGVIDMRKFSGLRRLMPYTCWTFVIGCLALSGVFPFAGFWSKDQILGSLHDKAELGHQNLVFGLEWLPEASFYHGLYWLGVIVAGMTAFYTFRAYFMTFEGPEKIPHEAGHHAHESPPNMTVPLIILAICAASVGFIFDHRLADFIGYAPSLAYGPIAATHGKEVFHWNVALLSTVLALAGIGFAAYLYLGARTQAAWLARTLRPLYLLSYNKFYIDEIYDLLIVRPLVALARLCYLLDRLLVDGIVNFIGAVPGFVGSQLRALQGGMVQFYALAMALGVLVLLGALVMWPAG